MQYRLRVTREASEDVTGLAGYIARKFANIDAALNFLDKYDKEVQRLTNFPFGYRGVSFEYRGYEIRIKSFGTYNVFFTVDIAEKQVFVLRVLRIGRIGKQYLEVRMNIILNRTDMERQPENSLGICLGI